MRKYQDIEEIKQANKELGHHWFDTDTMKFFNCRIHGGVIRGKYFVTSEASDILNQPRRYSIRSADETGAIQTHNGFGNYASVQMAEYDIEAGKV